MQVGVVFLAIGVSAALHENQLNCFLYPNALITIASNVK
jgi:hypothetical protein